MDWALTAFPKPVNKYVAKPNNNTNVLLFMFLYQTGVLPIDRSHKDTKKTIAAYT